MKRYKVLILDGNGQYCRMFEDNGFDVVSDLEYGPDLVCFTGGADVTPSMYGEKSHRRTYSDRNRDTYEAELYSKLLDLGIPCVGICRGGQFLNVMNGGKMHQHVEGHATGNNHILTDLDTLEEVMVSSTHHQMMIPEKDATIIGVARICEWVQPQDDIEVVFYPRTDALCFQPHPEFFNKEHECVKYFFKLIFERLL
jgi:gamma-glutamyl-gamma-aminobutyrate hydrolase PuuD